MDDERIKKAVLGAIEKSIDAHDLAEVVRAFARAPRPTHPDDPGELKAPTPGAKRLLTRIVLGDILDESILAARPQDRTFPLRLFFADLSQLLASDDDDDAEGAAASEAAFTLASGLNFFFRAPLDDESKMRVGLAVSRQLYRVATLAKIESDRLTASAALLAALMSNELERINLESVDHVRVYDSQLHERAAGSDPTAFNILRPLSFLCRVAANGAVKAKAEVLT